jgi:hypothetical protein
LKSVFLSNTGGVKVGRVEKACQEVKRVRVHILVEKEYGITKSDHEVKNTVGLRMDNPERTNKTIG